MGPVIKLGRLVTEGKMESLEEIYLLSLTIKEHEPVGVFLGASLKDYILAKTDTHWAEAWPKDLVQGSGRHWTTMDMFQGLQAACLRSNTARSDPPETSRQKPWR